VMAKITPTASFLIPELSFCVSLGTH